MNKFGNCLTHAKKLKTCKPERKRNHKIGKLSKNHLWKLSDKPRVDFFKINKKA